MVDHPTEGRIRIMRASDDLVAIRRPKPERPAPTSRRARRRDPARARLLGGRNRDALVKDGVTRPPAPAQRIAPDGFCPDRRPGSDPRSDHQHLRALRRRLLAEEGQGGRISRRLPPRARRCRLARHLHARGIWRLGSRHHRSRDHDAGDRQIRRGHVGRFRGAYERVRAQSGGGVRHEEQKRRMLPPIDRGRATRPASR